MNRNSKDRDLIIHLLVLLSKREEANGVRFEHVRAHQGEPGNEAADASICLFYKDKVLLNPTANSLLPVIQRLAGKGTRLPAKPDRKWLTMENLKQCRQQQALRLAVHDDVARSITPAIHLLPDPTVDAELCEVERLLDSDTKVSGQIMCLVTFRARSPMDCDAIACGWLTVARTRRSARKRRIRHDLRSSHHHVVVVHLGTSTLLVANITQYHYWPCRHHITLYSLLYVYTLPPQLPRLLIRPNNRVTQVTISRQYLFSLEKIERYA